MALYTVPVYVTIEAEDEQDAVDHVTSTVGGRDLNDGRVIAGDPGHIAWYRVGDLVGIRYEVVCYDHRLQGVERVLPATRKLDTRYVSDNVRIETVACAATNLDDATKRLRDAYGFRLGSVTLL